MKQSILDLSPLPFGNRVLFLWPWSPEKPIQRLSLDSVPVWVKFPDLKLHYFNATVLSGLGSLIGKPLFMDKLTTTQNRVAFARICIEINVGEKPPHVIYFKDEEGKECSQEVIYEWMPSLCPKCRTFRHDCTNPTNQAKAGAGGFTHKSSSTIPYQGKGHNGAATGKKVKYGEDAGFYNNTPRKASFPESDTHQISKTRMLAKDPQTSRQPSPSPTNNHSRLDIHPSQNKFDALNLL